MNARRPDPRLAELQEAFAVFTNATATLEREYRALQEHARELRDQLEEKHRALMASLERQRELEVTALRHGRLAAMGEMAATLAHEVRNPLGAMALFARMLLDEVTEQAEPARLAGQVLRCIEDLDRVVNNILEFARLPTPDLGVVNVAHVVDEALAVAQVAAGGGVRIERRGAGTLSWILDRALVSQALVNLFRNAGDAMGGTGTLAVGVDVQGGRLDLSVADTGPGIPADRAESIFNPFFTTKTRGAGLGLAVARAAAVAHGGSLDLVPSAEGACFVLRLPRPSVSAPAEESRPVAARGHGRAVGVAPSSSAGAASGEISGGRMAEGTWNEF